MPRLHAFYHLTLTFSRQFDMDKPPKHKHRVKDKHAKDHQRQQTSIQHKTLEPVWNESESAWAPGCASCVVRRASWVRLTRGVPFYLFTPAFEFELNNPDTAILGIDLWDHDEEASVSGTLKGITKVVFAEHRAPRSWARLRALV